LQSFIVEALPAMGFSRLLAFVKGDNIPVLRSIKPPHRKTGKLFYFRFFGFNPVVIGLGSRELPQLVIPESGHRAAVALQYGRSGK
jgi:hypothetical protein